MIRTISKIGCFTLLIGAILASTVSKGTADDHSKRPNWKASVVGTTVPDPDDDPDDNFNVDIDTFSGTSSHLGRFTAEGSHTLDLTTFMFTGSATYTAANGDSLDVTYVGQLFPSDDTDFPFGFTACLWIESGTGSLSDAQGSAMFEGGFSGSPGEFFFDLEGTLHPKGK